jgi:hypothetical protein
MDYEHIIVNGKSLLGTFVRIFKGEIVPAIESGDKDRFRVWLDELVYVINRHYQQREVIKRTVPRDVNAKYAGVISGLKSIAESENMPRDIFMEIITEARSEVAIMDFRMSGDKDYERTRGKAPERKFKRELAHEGTP